MFRALSERVCIQFYLIFDFFMCVKSIIFSV